MRLAILPLAAVAAILSGVEPTQAAPCDLDVTVVFEEGAPQDRFSIYNDSAGDWTVGAITIDLGSSAGGLFFDTSGGGAGFAVFQPFAPLAATDVRLRRITDLRDGGSRITLDFDEMPPGRVFRFTLDVDDPDPASAAGATRIAASELAGAEVRAIMRGPNGTLSAKEGVFGDAARARIAPAWCLKLG